MNLHDIAPSIDQDIELTLRWIRQGWARHTYEYHPENHTITYGYGEPVGATVQGRELQTWIESAKRWRDNNFAVDNAGFPQYP